MRISKTRIMKLEQRSREQKVIDAKENELRRRMEAADARIDKHDRERMSPEEYSQYQKYRDACSKRFSELLVNHRPKTLAERMAIADKAHQQVRKEMGYTGH